MQETLCGCCKVPFRYTMALMMSFAMILGSGFRSGFALVMTHLTSNRTTKGEGHLLPYVSSINSSQSSSLFTVQFLIYGRLAFIVHISYFIVRISSPHVFNLKPIGCDKAMYTKHSLIIPLPLKRKRQKKNANCLSFILPSLSFSRLWFNVYHQPLLNITHKPASSVMHSQQPLIVHVID